MKLILLTLALSAGATFTRSGHAEPVPVPQKQAPAERVLTARDFDKWRDRSPSLEMASFLIAISPRLKPYRFRLIPDAVEAPVDGKAHHVGKIEIVSQDAGGTSQTIEVDSSRSASEFIRFFTVQDFNFDGFLDFGVLKDFGAKWGSYSWYLFDSDSGRFVTNALTEELGKIAANEMRADPVSRTIRCQYLAFEGILTETYKVQGAHLRLVGQKERRKDRSGRFEVVTKKLVNGKMKAVRTERVKDPYKAGDAN